MERPRHSRGRSAWTFWKAKPAESDSDVLYFNGLHYCRLEKRPPFNHVEFLGGRHRWPGQYTQSQPNGCITRCIRYEQTLSLRQALAIQWAWAGKLGSAWFLRQPTAIKCDFPRTRDWCLQVGPHTLVIITFKFGLWKCSWKSAAFEIASSSGDRVYKWVRMRWATFLINFCGHEITLRKVVSPQPINLPLFCKWPSRSFKQAERLLLWNNNECSYIVSLLGSALMISLATISFSRYVTLKLEVWTRIRWFSIRLSGNLEN